MAHAKSIALIVFVVASGYLLIFRGELLFTQKQEVTDWSASFQLFVDDRQSLEQFESVGFASTDLFSRGNSELFQSLKDEVASVVAASKQHFKEVEGQYAHTPRFFDPGWLSVETASFLLGAVVVRPDRPFDSSGCGELRFIYRLGYDALTKNELPISSDLPMTVNAVWLLPIVQDCAQSIRVLVNQLNQPDKSELSTLFNAATLNRIEVNFQINRYPHDGSLTFADQAHYGLMVLKKQNDRFVPQGLENTPDVERLQKNPELQQKLWTYLQTEALQKEVDRGTFLIPKEFLAKSAVSVTPHGGHRLSNRPFTSLFYGEEFKMSAGNSKLAFLNRLDESSCVGCHGLRSIAGFHVLGQRRNITGYFNRLVRPVSAYFDGIQAWRLEHLKASTGSKPALPPVGRTPASGQGTLCKGAMIDESFATWGCEKGLECMVGYPESYPMGFGQCAKPEKNTVGRLCDKSLMESDASNPLKDIWTHQKIEGCDGIQFCTQSVFGFPGGFCTTGCFDQPGTRCSKIPALGPFTICLEDGGVFAECLAKHYAEVAMPICKSHKDCRLDYLCAATEGEEGICTPQYFLHQLTIENHPIDK